MCVSVQVGFGLVDDEIQLIKRKGLNVACGPHLHFHYFSDTLWHPYKCQPGKALSLFLLLFLNSLYLIFNFTLCFLELKVWILNAQPWFGYVLTYCLAGLTGLRVVMRFAQIALASNFLDNLSFFSPTA